MRSFRYFCANHYRMKETLSSIAERTGYSITTVSRVLNGVAEKYRISEKAREAIIKEARRCNYSPNVIARNLRTSRTNTIGLILPSVANPYFADLSSTIISEANKNGYSYHALACIGNRCYSGIFGVFYSDRWFCKSWILRRKYVLCWKPWRIYSSFPSHLSNKLHLGSFVLDLHTAYHDRLLCHIRNPQNNNDN